MSTIIEVDQFTQLNPEDIEIGVNEFSGGVVKTTYVIKCEIKSLGYAWTVHKRYTEFQGFYDFLTKRYQNIAFPSFPSKYQIFNKVEYRKKYFDSLLKIVLEIAKTHSEMKSEILKLLYDFVFSSHSEKNTMADLKKNHHDGKKKLDCDSENLSSNKSTSTSKSKEEKGKVK